MDPCNVKSSWRKPVGILLILLLILGWSAIVAIAADWVIGLAWPLTALFFLVAGIAWILPLKPLLRWMETGKWRE
jgi:Na+/H+-dicarboxylate symporter